MKNLSVQQFTFLPWVNQEGLFPVLKAISKMGYTGLEMCCFGGFDALGLSAKELRLRLDDLGMHLIGNYFSRNVLHGNGEPAFEYVAEAGGKYAVFGTWGSYATPAEIQEKADDLNTLSAYAQKAGITLLYHNHSDEFAYLNGKLVIDHLTEALDPHVFLEHDVFFPKKLNLDVYDYLRTHSDRVRAVHLKQIDTSGENVDLPDGIIDMAEVLRCATQATDFILEQAAFPESISKSLQRNAAFLKNL